MIVSQRAAKQIDTLYAIVTRDEHGKEGVVRRDTPSGTQGLVTDDVLLAETLRKYARKRFPDAQIIAFKRV